LWVIGDEAAGQLIRERARRTRRAAGDGGDGIARARPRTRDGRSVRAARRRRIRAVASLNMACLVLLV
jgi:hypothetical protein